MRAVRVLYMACELLAVKNAPNYLFIYVVTKYIHDKHVGIVIHYCYMFRHAGVVKRLYG
jgi:hypothetical protein